MIDMIMVFLVLTNLVMLCSSRIAVLIRMVTIQCIALALIPIFSDPGALGLRQWLLAGGALLIKGVVFPVMLIRAQREANVRREVEPFVGYTLSLVLGLGTLAGAFWISSRLPLPARAGSAITMPLAMFTVLVGLFLIISRKKALTQVLGYLTLENGIYAFNAGVALEAPLLVELGMLLDIFVAVFVMGIFLFHINREFDHIDADRLSVLHDLPVSSSKFNVQGSEFSEFEP